jgi:hypothetical protein
MKKVRTVRIVFFSGTGGTARIAAGLHRAFARRDIEAFETELDGKEQLQPRADLLVLLSPVYAGGAPAPVFEWIGRAPGGNGAPAAVFSVSGGGEVPPNTACRRKAIRQLGKKGYDVRYENMFVMPGNVFFSYGDVLSAMLLRAVPQKTEEAVSGLLSGERERTRPCPQKAIVAGRAGRFFVLREGYDLDALERRTRQMTEFPPVSRAAKGLLYLGVRKYLRGTEEPGAG